MKKRTRSYLLFYILFLIGIGLVSIPFYSLYKLMVEENKIVREQISTLKKEIEKIAEHEKFQKEYFLLKINEAKQKIIKLETPGVDVDKLNADIGGLLSRMEEKSNTDTTWRSYMYTNMINTLIELKQSKNKIIQASSGSNRELNDCLNQLEKSKQKTYTLQRNLQRQIESLEVELEKARTRRINPKKK